MDPITIALGLAQLAPTVMRYFGVGEKPVAVAEKVIDIAKTVTGAPTGEAALAALQADAAKLHDFRMATLAADTELEKAYLSDRDSARRRDTEIIKANGHNWRADILAFLAVAGLVICVYLVATNAGLPERAVNAIMFVAGVLASAVRDVYGFEFGSSRGSKEKDDIVAKLAGRNV